MAKLYSTKRGKAAIAGIIAIAIGGFATVSGTRVPDDVALAATFLVKPWEGRHLRAYPDPATGGVPWTICDGDTKGVKPGLVETPAGCDKRLVTRMAEFRAQLVRCIPGFDKKPLSWRAMMNSLSYNIGTGIGATKGGSCNSTAARLGRAGDYLASCSAATAFNKANNRVFIGLVNRREMGDARRIGEGELCVSGL
ncbi:lysozyme [Kaistia terrae]|uniref:Lysozyme n=1 Tax=Kaistia terrae TaxID=537017 RepID=A0ABW0Q2M1_9HYPH|nr:lysozyme [Kaistia terrae]MCX5581309.1 lysozyme [Kaistia terrae]